MMKTVLTPPLHILKSESVCGKMAIFPCYFKFGIWMKILIFSKFAITQYRQVSNIRRTLVGNKIVDHSDVVGASPVGAAPTASSFST